MSTFGPFRVDGNTIPFRAGATVLETLLRAGLHPTGGGCLCCTGDCPHCLATVDGVAYVRTCQVEARAGMQVLTEHRDGRPPRLCPDPARSPAPGELAEPTRRLLHLHHEVVVVGAGASGCREATRLLGLGKELLILEARRDRAQQAQRRFADRAQVLWAEVVGLYAGPLVVARSAPGEPSCTIVQVHIGHEIVVATGSSALHAVAPGSELPGLYTPHAAHSLSHAGLALGHTVTIVAPAEPTDVAPGRLPDSTVVHGWPTRFLPATDGVRISAVEVVEQDGNTSRHSCDSVVLDLGRQPRNSLLRMGHGLPVRAVGSAAEEGDLPPPPCSAVGGTVCACAQVTVDDLDSVYERGFTELELVKRATLAGTGTCQGSCCVPHLRSYLQARGTRLQPPFTARPVARQLTLGEMAAGAWHPASARSPLHEEHLRQGALMERAGGWWRPWTYGDTAAEIDAVRSAVSLGDVSTLGKFLVDGPDALRLLELLYPIDVSALRNGRCRYTLLLDERGSVLDDGMICRESASRFYLTSTSGGAGFAELWMRDWIESAEFDVRLLDVTHGRGAINVTGPQAARLLARGGAEDLPPFAAFVDTRVCGVPCRILRLSFTGELSYELHHDVEYSVPLWRRLLELGADLGVQPHGLAALLALRLEKGHIVVGKDTDLDATPRRLRHDWAISPRNQSFVGRQALERTGRLPLDRVLVGLESDLPVPVEGSVVFAHSVSDPSAAAASADTPEHVGYVTSAAASHEGDHAVMLAWVACTEGAETPTHFAVNGRPAHRVELPFYDPQHRRARGAVDHAALLAEESRSAPQRLSASVMVSNRFHRITSLRIASTTTALDRLEAHPRKATVLRCAQDEALVIDARWPSDEIDLRRALPLEQLLAEDPYALVVEERGFAGHWLPAARARQALRHLCSWPIPQPHDRPVLAQGAVAELPVKLWIEAERILFLVPAPFAATLDERLAQIEEPTA